MICGCVARGVDDETQFKPTVGTQEEEEEGSSFVLYNVFFQRQLAHWSLGL